ncbi:cholesterol 7-desaturase [Orussus abietinus]|uniref:cholesterol 7-desaturase n=1 Tax=Orussus abietinus TaxID=222816 RepID=UPI00062693FD|nr:cholesterol 7-desaturase [Orussus abietinus]
MRVSLGNFPAPWKNRGSSRRRIPILPGWEFDPRDRGEIAPRPRVDETRFGRRPRRITMPFSTYISGRPTAVRFSWPNRPTRTPPHETSESSSPKSSILSSKDPDDRPDMIGSWIAGFVGAITCLLYLAYFWKVNWVKDLRKLTRSHRSLAGSLADTGQRKFGKLPPVYPNGWFCLLESWQLKPREVKHVSALGENFAVFRTEKGIVRVIDAYCPHLGANMAEGGRVKGDCLECPFHGWSFRGEDGRCDAVPYSKKVPEYAKVRTWKSCEVNNGIFVWYHAESADPEWSISQNENLSNGTWRYQGRNQYLVNSHIQEIPENGADWAHLTAVHGPAMFIGDLFPGLIRHSWTNVVWTPRYKPSSSPNPEDSTEGNEINGRVPTSGEDAADSTGDSEENRSQRHIATMNLRHCLVLFDRFEFLCFDVKVDQIGPAYVELLITSTLGPVFIVQTVLPVSPLVQRVTHVVYSSPLLTPYASLILIGECVMFERDVAVWNYKRYERRPVLVKEDRGIMPYRRWYSQFYSANSPTYSSAKTLDW